MGVFSLFWSVSQAVRDHLVMSPAGTMLARWQRRANPGVDAQLLGRTHRSFSVTVVSDP